MSAFANCGRAVAHVRGSYVPKLQSVSSSAVTTGVAFGQLRVATKDQTKKEDLHANKEYDQKLL